MTVGIGVEQMVGLEIVWLTLRFTRRIPSTPA
jgi:hypothetical protein